MTQLKKYNKEPFLLRHAVTVEAVMRHFAQAQGLAGEADYWAMVGLLHDVDYGSYPEEHLQHSERLLREIGVSDAFIYSVNSHGYKVCNEVEPKLLMEKVLFAADELTGLIYACQLMRPSKSTKDMELSSLKKKFKDRKFAAGCSRDVIEQGAAQLGWSLDELLQSTLTAMQESEDAIEEAVKAI